MNYILCEFEYGYVGQLYQEISGGSVVRYTDLDGNTLELVGDYGYHIIDANPPTPTWVNE
jgi:hypothetical protein